MDREVQGRSLSVPGWGGCSSSRHRPGQVLADLALWAKVVQTAGCSTFTHGAKPATRRVADGERMNPQGKSGAFAPHAGDDEHQGDEDVEDSPAHPGLPPRAPACMAPVAPLFHPLPSCADAAGSSLHQRGDPAPRVWAISGPLAPVHTSQLRTSRSNELPSSADLTARCNTPSKLVMRVRFPSPALKVPAQLKCGFPVIGAYLTGKATGPACHTRATTTADVMHLARPARGLMPVSRRRLGPRGRTCPEPSRSPGHGHAWRADRSSLRGRWSARAGPSAL
jgi:hypothetical protein